jgi:hypothetical protein
MNKKYHSKSIRMLDLIFNKNDSNKSNLSIKIFKTVIKLNDEFFDINFYFVLSKLKKDKKLLNFNLN